MIPSIIKGLFGIFLALLPFMYYETREGRGTHYGAIAVSKDTMQFGTSDHLPSKSKAKKAAIASCVKAKEGTDPKKCKVQVWFYDGCGALAIDPHKGDKKDGAWGTSWAGTKKVAEEKALENCSRYSYRGKCSIAASFCSI